MESRFEFEAFAAPRRQSASALRTLSHAQEMELAMELLSVSSEAELDHFLGNVFKKVWGGIKKVGSFVAKAAKPFAGALRSLAKTALPFVGKALGTFIPIPGVGTAIGGALGSALSNALEMEFSHLEYEDREFESARRFVRIAQSATSQLAQANPAQPLGQAIEQALGIAVRRHMPNLDVRAAMRAANRVAARNPVNIGSGGFGFGSSRSINSANRDGDFGHFGSSRGGWFRQGGNIVLEL
jgi:hypothetical protein